MSTPCSTETAVLGEGHACIEDLTEPFQSQCLYAITNTDTVAIEPALRSASRITQLCRRLCTLVERGRTRPGARCCRLRQPSRADALRSADAGWFEWALRVNTTNKGDNVWGFAQCYELGYLKYADLFGVPS